MVEDPSPDLNRRIQIDRRSTLSARSNVMESHPQNSAASPPGVSVIIPAYNYAHYLPSAINSVLRQDYPVIEIIVVDDGSKDNCAEVVARYRDRVRYIHQENTGLSAARNTGIHVATHPFIAFLDADDIWRPGMLTRIIETFLRLPGEFAVVACPYILTDTVGIPLQDKRLDSKFFGEITMRDIVLKNRFYPSATVVRKSVFDECGFFDTTLRSSEDRDMWIRVAARHRVYLIKEPMALIRKHGTNMSRNADRMKQNMAKVIAKVRQSGVVSQGNSLFWRRVNSIYYYQTAWMYHDEGRPVAALRDLLVSLFSWPFWWSPNRLNENFLFRLRSGFTFLMAGVRNWLKSSMAM